MHQFQKRLRVPKVDFGDGSYQVGIQIWCGKISELSQGEKSIQTHVTTAVKARSCETLPWRERTAYNSILMEYKVLRVQQGRQN